MIIMMLDVESVGLHGQAFAAGYSVYDLSIGREIRHDFAWIPTSRAKGTQSGLEWVRANVVPHLEIAGTVLGGKLLGDQASDLRNWFWRAWHPSWPQPEKVELWADVA